LVGDNKSDKRAKNKEQRRGKGRSGQFAVGSI
jgi:hypothetical protein